MKASEQYVRTLIEDVYDLGSVLAVRSVPSEADLTALVQTVNGEIVAKTTLDERGRWSLRLQAESQQRLHTRADLASLVPAVLANVSGDLLTFDSGATTMVMAHQQGAPLSDVTLSDDLIRQVAHLQHRCAAGYADYRPTFDMYAYTRPWDLGTFCADRYDLDQHLVPDLRKLADEVCDDVASLSTKAAIDSIYTRPQVIFGDLNLSNVLCVDGSVSGLIDFGDVVTGTQLADIAIALCYLSLHDRRIAWHSLLDIYLGELQKHQTLPTEAELTDLGILVRGRALMILLNGRETAALEPTRGPYALRYDAAAEALLVNRDL